MSQVHTQSIRRLEGIEALVHNFIEHDMRAPAEDKAVLLDMLSRTFSTHRTILSELYAAVEKIQNEELQSANA
jgi:hypothetical protein